MRAGHALPWASCLQHSKQLVQGVLRQLGFPHSGAVGPDSAALGGGGGGHHSLALDDGLAWLLSEVPVCISDAWQYAVHMLWGQAGWLSACSRA